MVSIERRVPFNVLAPGVQAIRAELDAAIGRVLDSGWFLMGPELEGFEREFAGYHGHGLQAVGVATGTTPCASACLRSASSPAMRCW